MCPLWRHYWNPRAEILEALGRGRENKNPQRRVRMDRGGANIPGGLGLGFLVPCPEIHLSIFGQGKGVDIPLRMLEEEEPRRYPW